VRILIPLTMAACLLAAAPSHAHTLSIRKAEALANVFADRLDRSIADDYPDEVTVVERCLRRTRHEVICELNTIGVQLDCTFDLHIRYLSKRGTRTGVKPRRFRGYCDL
jgi:hypothetical protein